MLSIAPWQKRLLQLGCIPISLLLLSACATNDSVSDRRNGQHLICHKGHTQAVTSGDFFKHQDHGDAVGPCPEDQ